MCNLLDKDVPFNFDEECLKAYKFLREAVTKALIIQPPDWSLPFEIMCNAFDFTIRAILGQRVNKYPIMIYYASRTLNEAQINYTTTEKELLAAVFALEKFRSYLLGSKIMIYSDHTVLRYLLSKKDNQPWLIRWILLLQEFDIEIWDRKWSKNIVADHLSRILVEDCEPASIEESFLDKQLLVVSHTKAPWFTDIVNYLAVE